MRAARFHTQDSSVHLEDVGKPAVGPDEVRVDVQAASIHGSDVHFFHGTLSDPTTDPVTMGHEGAGVVDAVGENVTHVSVGDRVAIHYVDSCGNCKPCLRGNDHRCRHRGHLGDHRHGTFAEYVTIPGRGALRIADGVPFEWVHGVSANQARWFDLEHARAVLGYRPEDDAGAPKWDDPPERYT